MSDGHPFRDEVNARHDWMVVRVETMLKLHKDLPKAKRPHEQESLQRRIAADDKQIDQLVYRLKRISESWKESRNEQQNNPGSVPPSSRIGRDSLLGA